MTERPYCVSFLRPKKAKYPVARYELLALNSTHAVSEACKQLIFQHGGIMANYKRVDVKEIACLSK